MAGASTDPSSTTGCLLLDELDQAGEQGEQEDLGTISVQGAHNLSGVTHLFFSEPSGGNPKQWRKQMLLVAPFPLISRSHLRLQSQGVTCECSKLVAADAWFGSGYGTQLGRWPRGKASKVRFGKGVAELRVIF